MKAFSLLLILFFCNTSYGIEFNRDIKPILSRKCFSCHGKEKQKGKLRLDLREEALKVFRPDNKGQIEFLSRINHSDPDELMPPPDKNSLSDDEKSLLSQWVKDGAQYDLHWSFQPLKEISVPNIKDSWISNDIDKFVLEKLKNNKLTPQKVLFDHKLFRRASLMATGLPPNEKDFKLFRDGKLKYNQYVNKLLESKAYGEHMASFWLDAARYGDTNGIEYDNSRPIWPYRDWVINAFNENKPYDEFCIEQLAGDLLPNSTIQQKVATGFLRCNVSTNEEGSIEEEYKVAYAKDRLNTTASVFMGLTVGCAECHDHKYDPVSQKEYYQLLAFFNNLDGAAVGLPFDRSDPPLVTVTSTKENFKLDELASQKEKLKSKLKVIKKGAQDSFWWWHYQQIANPPKDIFLMGKMDAYFPLDEHEGSATYNLITEHKCNIKGPLLRKKGKYGNALEFKGFSIVDCLNVSNYEKNSTFSVGSWVYPKKENTGTILTKFDSKYSKGWKLSIDRSRISFQLSSSEDDAIIIQAQDPLEINKWSQVTVSYDGSASAQGLKLYINGKSVKFQVISDNLKGEIGVKRNLRIGLESYANILRSCMVDEVFTTKMILNSDEIQLISNFKAESRFALIKPDKLTSIQKESLFKYYLENHHKDYSREFKILKSLEEKEHNIISNAPRSMIMKEATTPTKTFILSRGNYEAPGKMVSRNTPSFLPKFPKTYKLNRLGFAKWMADKKNPLFARNIVNRYWYIYFGKGISHTLADLGSQGQFPSHPQLLDFLSNYLIENNWNLKKLSELILLSSIFKQSSRSLTQSKTLDPENKCFAHYPRHRLRAEVIRDSILKVSGILEQKIGGKPVFPYQPPGLWKEVTSEDSNTSLFKQSIGTDNNRRSIYTFWKRNLPPPFMTIFDAPTRQTCTLSRNTSNTPLQALALLNDPQFSQSFKSLTARINEKPGKETEKIKSLFRKILYREATKQEIEACNFFLKNSDFKWETLVQSLMNTDEFLSSE